MIAKHNELQAVLQTWWDPHYTGTRSKAFTDEERLVRATTECLRARDEEYTSVFRMQLPNRSWIWRRDPECSITKAALTNMKKHWKCATSDRCPDVYITTLDAGDLAGRTEIEITEARMHEAREAFFYYSLPRGIVLTDCPREVSAVPGTKTEVASGYAGGPKPQPFSISAIVYEVAVDEELKKILKYQRAQERTAVKMVSIPSGVRCSSPRRCNFWK